MDHKKVKVSRKKILVTKSGDGDNEMFKSYFFFIKASSDFGLIIWSTTSLSIFGHVKSNLN